MRNIILFIDGGQKKLPGRGNWVTGFGVRAHFRGASLEIRGAYPLEYGSSKFSQYNQGTVGQHELIAFVEGMLFAKSHGYAFSEMVFYTDDENVAFGGQWLADISSWQRGRIDIFKDRIKTVCEELYAAEVYEDAVECLQVARFHKVKGHDCCVDNERVDYLVKRALDEAIGISKGPTKDYSEWLTDGLVRYRANGDVRIWTPAFVPVPGIDPQSLVEASL